MKQEIINHLSIIEEEIHKISKFLYEHPEESFNEHKANSYLTNVLKENGFTIQESFLDIPTAFIAQFGEGHPKICYICEYDCSCKEGHILGSNLISSMSIGAAIGLSKVIPKTGGSVILLGCPGEFLGGTKVTMAKQGVFEDIDIILMAQPSFKTANCCSSPALLPIKIIHKCDNYSCFEKNRKISTLDVSLYTLNSINTILKAYPSTCSIDKIFMHGKIVPIIAPDNIVTTFTIEAPSLDMAEEIKNKIAKVISALDDFTGLCSKIELSEVPYDNFICNKTLCRILSHNLKEVGIIDIEEDSELNYGLSLGTVSHKVPSIRFFINISEENSIKYACTEFGEATLSPFAKERVLNTVKALALTGLDLISRPNLIAEARHELQNTTTKKTLG